MPSSRSSTAPKRAADANALADLLEFAALSLGQRAISYPELRREVERTANLGARNLPLATQQLAWRQRVLGGAYPFLINDTTIRLSPRHAIHDLYNALLVMTPGLSSALGTSRDEAASAWVLENATCAALEGLLGPGTRAIRFGWPSDSGRPQDFDGAIKWLAETMRIRLSAGYRPPRRKDGGVDVVAWRPFSDGRPGFPIVLAQCTIEADVLGKARDIDIKQWNAWLALDASILIALSIPGTVPRDENWNELARNNVVLERLRLVSLAALAGNPPHPSASHLVTAFLARVQIPRD